MARNDDDASTDNRNQSTMEHSKNGRGRTIEFL